MFDFSLVFSLFSADLCVGNAFLLALFEPVYLQFTEYRVKIFFVKLKKITFVKAMDESLVGLSSRARAGCAALGTADKAVSKDSFCVGTGLVPVLNLRRTATRVVPTITSSRRSKRVGRFFNSLFSLTLKSVHWTEGDDKCPKTSC